MSFPADATLVVSLVGAASLFAIAQVAEQDKSAEEEVRRLNTQEVQAFLAVWMRQRGGWQQAARHANIVPQQ